MSSSAAASYTKFSVCSQSGGSIDPDPSTTKSKSNGRTVLHPDGPATGDGTGDEEMVGDGVTVSVEDMDRVDDALGQPSGPN
jgi:hypothetical protein